MKRKGNKKMPRPRHEIIDSPIPTFLSMCYAAVVYTVETQRFRDRVINGVLSRSRHLLVPLLFHEVTSLHPPSFQRNDFSTCSTSFFYLEQSPNKNEM